jgi:transcription elongation factor Elf1
MPKFRPKIKNKRLPDGWFRKPQGKIAKMASDLATQYRCPSCGHHIQAKIAVVIQTNTAGNFTIEPKITCDTCNKEYVEVK